MSKRRTRGPGHAMSVREQGDPTKSAALAEALVADGPTERGTHGFHTYPAGLHPDAARILIEGTQGAVHDPFCGGGTVPVEALLQGRVASGSDLSPIALLVAGTRVADPALASPMRSAARKIADGAKLRVDVEVSEDLNQWYEPHVAQELGRLRDGINQADESIRPLLQVVLSSIVVKTSFRESDTSLKRITHHRRPQSTAVLFHKKARELGRALEAMPAEGQGQIFRGDARKMAAPHEVGLILTSPPYPGVYDYIPLQQLRYLWLGIDPGGAARSEIASRRSFRADRRKAVATFRDDTRAWILCQAKALVSGGAFMVVVGDGLVGGKLVDALSPTVEALREAGAHVVARASADREDFARKSMRTEHLVWAEKR